MVQWGVGRGRFKPRSLSPTRASSKLNFPVLSDGPSPIMSTSKKRSGSSDLHADDPLPPGWTRQFSKSQRKYFYHHQASAVTQWHFPTATEARDPAVAKKRAEDAREREKKRPVVAPHEPTSTTTTTTRSSGGGAAAEAAAAAAAGANSSKRPRADDFLPLADSTSVAIIVPYRDLHAEQKRAAHLQQFIPHMIAFLSKCQADGLVSDYHIYIIEQSDDGLKFNRGKLLNIGFDLAARKSGREHDVFIFHDVDLLPADSLLTWYSKFPRQPIHIARVWDRYSNNPKYFGGVVSFSKSDYGRINGVRCVLFV